MTEGLSIERRFTANGTDPFDTVEWSLRDSRITNPDGSVVFEMKDAEIPAGWSQVAADIMVSKYFRKAGVPQVRRRTARQIIDEDGEPRCSAPSSSARQVIRSAREPHGDGGARSTTTSQTACRCTRSSKTSLRTCCCTKMAAPNSPQWFNTGLQPRVMALRDPSTGLLVRRPQDRRASSASPDSYSRPAPHACFIQSVGDDLVSPGGIMDLWVREARLFKFGSGTGTNFSNLRAEGEPLSGGGKSSGLMSFLKVGDRAAGAIKSGGTTRRAAKMVILDVDHPDIESVR